MMPYNIIVQVYLTIYLTFIFKIYAQMAGQLHKLHVNKLTLALAAGPDNFTLQQSYSICDVIHNRTSSSIGRNEVFCKHFLND